MQPTFARLLRSAALPSPFFVAAPSRTFPAARSRLTSLQHQRRAASASSSVPARCPRPPTSSPAPSSQPRASAKQDSNLSPWLLLLTAVPITCAYLTYWQIYRLKWKVELIEELELNLGRKAIELPDEIEHSVLPEFNYRKVALRGCFPPLNTPGLPPPIMVGPRILDGEPGYQVIMPFLRAPSSGEPNAPPPRPILVNLGFVPSSLITPHAFSHLRLPQGEVVLEGMLRNKGMGKLASAKEGKPTLFTPDNDEKGRNWYWVDTERFAEYYKNDKPGGWGEVEPVMVDAIYEGTTPKTALYETGMPVGRPPKIELRNQHAVYALTWASISVVTSALLYRVYKTGRIIKPRSGRGGR